MAESIEGISIVGEKAMDAVCDADLKNTTEQVSLPSELITKPEDIDAQGDRIEVDQITPEAEKDAAVSASAEESLPEDSSNLPVVSTEELVAAPSCEDTTDTAAELSVTNTVTEAAEEAVEESSEQSSKKRKPENDEDLCNDETKKLKTEDAPADNEVVESSNETASESAQSEAVQLNEVSTPVELENNKEIEAMDSEAADTAAAMDSEAADAAAESNIPVEDQITTNEAEGVVDAVQEVTDVLNQQEDDKDLSENKENVISEVVSNGSVEPIKTVVESAEEETAKVSAAKNLDEIEAPIEAETVSS